MGDVVMAARNRVQGGRGPRESKYAQLPIAPVGMIPTRYYVSMTVKDRPGVLASVATEFGKREVSIAEVRQKGIVRPLGPKVNSGAIRENMFQHVSSAAAIEFIQWRVRWRIQWRITQWKPAPANK